MIEVLLTSALRSLLVAAATGVVLLAFRVRDAGLRHRAWTLVLVATLMMPALTATLPVVELALLPSSDGSDVAVAINTERGVLSAQESSRPFRLAGVIVYLIVATALLVRHGVGYCLGRRLVGSARCVDDTPAALTNEHVRVMESAKVAVPVTFGWLRPAILLPDSFREWTRAKLAAVIAHEAAHVERRDFALGALASVARALLWFHPLVWWLERHLSTLAEQAADDRAAGAAREAYAEHLVEFARAPGTGRLEGLAFVRTRGLTSRIERLLNPRYQNMAKPKRCAVISTLSLVGLLALTAATLVVTEASVTATSGEEVALTSQVVAPGLTDEEQIAYQGLDTDEERIRFLEQAVLRREALLASGAEGHLAEEHERQLENSRLQYEQALAEFAFEASQRAEEDARSRELAVRRARQELAARESILALEAQRRELRLREVQLELEAQQRDATVGDLQEARSELETQRRELGRTQLELLAQRRAIELAYEAAEAQQGIVVREARGEVQDGPFEVGGDVTAPELLERVNPVYPAEARAAGVSGGTYVVEAIVRSDGTVEILGVAYEGKEYADEFTEAATTAIGQWRFSPATRDGEPVDVTMAFEINFQLQ